MRQPGVAFRLVSRLSSWRSTTCQRSFRCSSRYEAIPRSTCSLPGAKGEGPAVDLAPADVDQPGPVEVDEQGEVCPLGARLGGDGVDEPAGEQRDREAELP